MTLTNDQQRALFDFKTFLESGSSVFILRGAAGTGKTTILKEFIRLLNEENTPFNIMTPTGRAALVSKERTGYNAATIHRSIYGILELPRKIDDKYVFELKENRDTINTVYFIDEASMVSDKFSDNEMFIFGSGRLLNDFIDYCNIYSSNRKIVFIGDHVQLPPVGQQISPALSEEYLKETYGVTALSSTLSEVVRQANESQINQNAQQIRIAVEKHNYTNFSINDGADVSKVEIGEFIAKYTKAAQQSSVEDCMVVTYSNSTALEYNQLIRERRYGKASLPIQANDLLLITRNNYSKDVELFNGTIVKAVSVDNTIDTQIAFVGKEQYTISFRRVTILADGQSISTLILDDFLTSNEGALSFTIQKALWANFEQRMNSLGITRNNEEFKIRIRKDEYLNALQCKYGYAITCHKAQGGEWQNVFVDMDRAGAKTNEDYFRWAYTAITRAKGALFHISSPSFKRSDFIGFGALEKCADKNISYYYPDGTNFLDYYFEVIKTRCTAIGVNCQEDRAAQYQHRITFTDTANGESCRLALWYNKKGYNRKIDCISSSNDEFKSHIDRLLHTLTPDIAIPYIPRFEEQGAMNERLKLCAAESQLHLTNIEQQEWSESYYFSTEHSICIIELYFNSKGLYTKIQPKTSQVEDTQINEFIESIKFKLYGAER